MKIVNRKKFIRSISITIFLILFMIIIFTNVSLSHSEIKYKQIAVSSGDTLWSLAKYEKSNNPYFEDTDIRDIIEVIKTSNNLKSSNINAYDELLIPTI